MNEPKLRILFFSESVTLAHLARIAVLIKALDTQKYEIHLASEQRYLHLFPDLDVQLHPIRSIESSQFLHALSKGEPLYSASDLIAYAEQDMAVINKVKPNVVVGDFRLSLAISAKLCTTPYVTITNSYWSPYCLQKYPLPDHPMERVFGAKLGQSLFDCVRPAIFAMHCLPMRKARKHFGLPTLGWDLRRVYTEADYVLYADVAELSKMQVLPDNHRHIGPIIWSPTVDLPDWWHTVTQQAKPVIYVALGSSGQSDLIPSILRECSQMPVIVILSTAGRLDVQDIPQNAYVSDYLPGEAASNIASLIICNGGSMTTQQAMIIGKPVLGIASNMDQHLNMASVTEHGAGLLLREYGAVPKIKEAISSLLSEQVYAERAENLAEIHKKYDAPGRFAHFISQF